MTYTYKTKGTCSTNIELEVEDGIVRNIAFWGGCNGNLKALAALTEGMTVDQVCERLKGITCGLKNTSCSDQLAQALAKAQEIEKKKAAERDSQAGA